MKKKLYIEGMSCQHCVMRVTNVLKDLDGVESVDVNLKEGYALVGISRILDDNDYIKAIDEAGYDFIRAENVQ